MMQKQTIAYLLIGLCLTQCTFLKPQKKNTAICNQLKSEMIFSNTADTFNANKQQADKPLVEKSYDNYDCDGS